MLTLALLAAVQSANAQPGAIRTFRDWAVGCDNGRRCKAVSLGPDGGEFPQVTVAIEREAGPAGALRLTFSGQATYRGPVTLRVDGKTIVTGGVVRDGRVTLSGADARRAALALVDGSRAEVLSGGRRIGSFSLAGSSAALRYMDAEQGRAGNGTALVARGGAPAARVPQPALPVIRRVPVGGRAAPVTPMLARQMAQMAACGERLPGEPRTFALGGGKTLVLFPCQMGAYNSVEAVFVVENGRARPAPFDRPVSMSDNDRVPSLMNSDYARGSLDSFGKGRGLGDCGAAERYVWDGARFRLSYKAEMPECRGSFELIETWRATVR